MVKNDSSESIDVFGESIHDSSDEVEDFDVKYRVDTSEGRKVRTVSIRQGNGVGMIS